MGKQHSPPFPHIALHADLQMGRSSLPAFRAAVEHAQCLQQWSDNLGHTHTRNTHAHTHTHLRQLCSRCGHPTDVRLDVGSQNALRCKVHIVLVGVVHEELQRAVLIAAVVERERESVSQGVEESLRGSVSSGGESGKRGTALLVYSLYEPKLGPSRAALLGCNVRPRAK
eukprot:1139252-Pelagomonas_calceolata.AAC.5